MADDSTAGQEAWLRVRIGHHYAKPGFVSVFIPWLDGGGFKHVTIASELRDQSGNPWPLAPSDIQAPFTRR
jgi:hypothetical protein